MIETGGHQFRTLAHPIYLGDGRRICRVYANDIQVYPEVENPDIIKVRGRRTIHASHSHSGADAEEYFGVGAANRFQNVIDGYYACSNSFDITVSFSAVLKSSYNGMFTAKTDGTSTTTDFTQNDNHIQPIDFKYSRTSVGDLIDYYNQTGIWDPSVIGSSEPYPYTPIPLSSYFRTCCPLFGTQPVPCPNYIRTPRVAGSYSNNSFIDADILVSIQMSTPRACAPILAGAIWREGAFSYREAIGKCNQNRTNFPELSANNGIHRVHAIVNCDPDNTNEYPNKDQYFLQMEDFRPFYSSQPAIGNGHVTCGFPSFAYEYNQGGNRVREAHIRYLQILGIMNDIGMSIVFSDWASQYNWTEDLSDLHDGGFKGGVYSGITLSQVPIEEFLYVGKYNDAPIKHREPQLDEL